MKKGNLFKNMIHTVGGFADKNSQTIMAVLAVGGLVGSVILAFKAAPKANKIIDDSKDEINAIDDSDEFTEEEKKKERKEVVKTAVKDLAPVLAPVVGCSIATASLMIGSTAISVKKINSLTSIATMSEVAYKELYEKTKEVVGEEKAKEIQEKAADEEMNKMAVVKPITTSRGGDYLCYDVMSGRLFYSDKETIREAVNNLNHCITSGRDDYVSLNDLYFELGLTPTAGGEDRGWGRYTANDAIELNLHNAIVSETGEPALVMDFLARPTLGYKGY
mgnify:CR=1 FL=1